MRGHGDAEVGAKPGPHGRKPRYVIFSQHGCSSRMPAHFVRFSLMQIIDSELLNSNCDGIVSTPKDIGKTSGSVGFSKRDVYAMDE